MQLESVKLRFNIVESSVDVVRAARRAEVTTANERLTR